MRASQRGQRRSRRAALRISGTSRSGSRDRRDIGEHVRKQSFETVVGGHVVRSRTGAMEASGSVLMLERRATRPRFSRDLAVP